MTSTRNPGNTSEERLPPAVLRILREVSRLLDEGHADKAQPLLAALGAHHELRTLHRPANLEDLFLKLTGRQIREEG